MRNLTFPIKLHATFCIGDSTGNLLLVPPGVDDDLKREVETTSQVQTKTVQPRTKPAILLMLMLHRLAPYFANALLYDVFDACSSNFKNL